VSARVSPVPAVLPLQGDLHDGEQSHRSGHQGAQDHVEEPHQVRNLEILLAGAVSHFLLLMLDLILLGGS
jgi:hypothetical protein